MKSYLEILLENCSEDLSKAYLKIIPLHKLYLEFDNQPLIDKIEKAFDTLKEKYSANILMDYRGLIANEVETPTPTKIANIVVKNYEYIETILNLIDDMYSILIENNEK